MQKVQLMQKKLEYLMQKVKVKQKLELLLRKVQMKQFVKE